MRKLFLACSILFSVYAIAAPAGNEKSCSKEKKCCKTGGEKGKSCCKAKAEASHDATEGSANIAPSTELKAAPAGKSCCKGKEKKCAGH